jgi:chromosome partitioning protein
LAEAPSHGVPALALEPKSKGALAYLALAGEVIRREEARERALTPTEAQASEPKVPAENE